VHGTELWKSDGTAAGTADARTTFTSVVVNRWMVLMAR
jgi:ELWxxDGT repeat protein